MQLSYVIVFLFIIILSIKLQIIDTIKKKNYHKKKIQSRKISPSDNSANQQNPNKGTSGTNKAYDQAQGNRGKQLNPNQNGGGGKGGGGGGKGGGGKK